MAHIDASEILPNGHVRELAADGRVTQLHRGHAYAEEGDTFEVDGTTFEVTAIERRTLGDLTDEELERGLALLDDACDGEDGWERARMVAEYAIRVAYDDYADALRGMGIDVTPAC